MNKKQMAPPKKRGRGNFFPFSYVCFFCLKKILTRRTYTHKKGWDGEFCLLFPFALPGCKSLCLLKASPVMFLCSSSRRRIPPTLRKKGEAVLFSDSCVLLFADALAYISGRCCWRRRTCTQHSNPRLSFLRATFLSLSSSFSFLFDLPYNGRHTC